MLTKVSALVLLFSSVVAAADLEQGRHGLHGLQLAADQQAYKLQVDNFACFGDVLPYHRKVFSLDRAGSGSQQ